MTQISENIDVEGPDRDGDYEIIVKGCDCDQGTHYRFINRAEADRLIDALKPDPSSPSPQTRGSANNE